MNTNATLKPPLTIEEQIGLLRSRGLEIKDFEIAKNFLLENNYYRLNYYFHKFMDSTNYFVQGTNFLRIRDIYETDRILRNNLLFILEPIEIKLKSSLAYYLGTKYGSDAFYQKSIFYDVGKFDEMLSYFHNEISNDFDNPIVKHHNVNYFGIFPIWVVVEFLTFGRSSKLFRNLFMDDQRRISRTYYNINERLFGNWINSLSVMRNICAHYGYLYKRSFSVHVNFGYDTNKFKSFESSLFGVFYCLQKLSDQNIWDRFMKTLQNKINQFTLINDYGFPADYFNFPR